MNIHIRGNLHKCNLCDYAATQAVHLKAHLKTHSGEKPYKCTQCIYASANLCNLRKHMHSGGEKPNIYNQCKFSSYEPRTLMIHVRIHSGEKPNKCSQCNYASHQEGNLKSHLKTHSGEKDYKCDKCNYKAARSEHLKSHMKRHTRLYKCNHCNDAFNLENDLRSHLKTHIDGQLLSNLQRQTQLGQSKVTLSNLIEVQKHLAEISRELAKEQHE